MTVRIVLSVDIQAVYIHTLHDDDKDWVKFLLKSAYTMSVLYQDKLLFYILLVMRDINLLLIVLLCWLQDNNLNIYFIIDEWIHMIYFFCVSMYVFITIIFNIWVFLLNNKIIVRVWIACSDIIDVLLDFRTAVKTFNILIVLWSLWGV